VSEIISIYVNGKLYENFTYCEHFRALDKASGEFLFKASNTAGQSFPFKKGDQCEIYIDSNKKMTGYINSLGGTQDAEMHEIRIRGRDKIQDLIDDSIKSTVDFKSSTDLLSVFQKVMSVCNITGISVSYAVPFFARRFSKSELISAKIGDNAFEFIEKYTRMRQLLITSDNEGNIILTRAGTSKYDTILKCEINGKDNNVLKSDFEDNDANRFYEYIVVSQSNPLAQMFPENATGIKGKSAIDSNIRTSRIKVINTDITSDIQTNSDRAKWESNIRRTKGFQYNCRMRGFYLDAKKTVLIEPNNMIQVIDDKFGINAELLIKACRYIKSLDGTFTDLELVNRDAFTLEEEQKGIEARFNKKDAIFQAMGL
jgi:prophage tail gpP-like protein